MNSTTRAPAAFFFCILFAVCAGCGGGGGGGGGGGASGGPSALPAAVTAVDLPAVPAGDVPLQVTVSDANGESVDLVLEISQDGGATWRAAATPDPTQLEGLSAQPSGSVHTIQWDSLADVGFRDQAPTRLRATPIRGTLAGTPYEVAAPVLDNLRVAAQRVAHYLIHYGSFTEDELRLAETYDLVIVHPFAGALDAATVHDIQDGVDPDDPGDDVIVLAYISIGEDLRTTSLSNAAMLADPRFVGDGSGPRTDPRGPDADGQSLVGLDPLGSPSNGGVGYASWYLDDNSVDQDPGNVGDGEPDRNGHFGGCFVNAGDPAWFNVLDQMTLDGVDGVPGMRELLRDDVGRGFACDGLFLDTVDTCAPNSFTDAASSNQSEYEWTAPGFADFIARLRTTYPQRLVLQNRGLFFFDPRHPHYSVTTRAAIDYLLLESYRLNSNGFEEYNDYFFPDNKHNVTPKVMAEAGRPDGFRVLSLGYAEGPPGDMDTNTLLATSTVGYDSLLEDILEAQDRAGFRHYLTDAGVALVNDFVRYHTDWGDSAPPVWTSTWNDNAMPWPTPHEAPTPRVGIQSVQPAPGRVVVGWDVALDLHAVSYALYHSTSPFDFAADPSLSTATRVILTPNRAASYGPGYGSGISANEDTLFGLTAGTTHYFCIRAFDSEGNEEQNQVTLSAIPRDPVPITVDGLFDDWTGVPLAYEDPADVADSSGPDWLRIWVTNDTQNLYIRYTSENVFRLDGAPGSAFSRTLVMIDADNNAGTGYGAGNSVGSELLVFGDQLYAQASGVFNDGFIRALDAAPLSAAVEFELAIPLSEILGRAPGASVVRMVFVNDEVGDRAPNGEALLYTLFAAP